jgi:hypothetical protein
MTPVKFEPKMRDMNSVHELSVKTLALIGKSAIWMRRAILIYLTGVAGDLTL